MLLWVFHDFIFREHDSVWHLRLSSWEMFLSCLFTSSGFLAFWRSGRFRLPARRDVTSGWMEVVRGGQPPETSSHRCPAHGWWGPAGGAEADRCSRVHTSLGLSLCSSSSLRHHHGSDVLKSKHQEPLVIVDILLCYTILYCYAIVTLYSIVTL